MIISICGAGMARSTAFTTRFMRSAAKPPHARQARPPRSSTARASRARKKGACDRSGGLRCRQEDQGQEAAHPRRYTGPADARHRARRRRPGPRRRRAADGELVWRLSVPDKLYADGGYQGPDFQSAMKRILARVNVEIVKRSDQTQGFVVLPKRWIVERTFAWLGRCRRLAKDWECLNHKALAFLRLASIRLMLRKLCNPA